MAERSAEIMLEYAAEDGTPVALRKFKADSGPRATLLIVHGMTEHGGRYARFASYLAERGIESWVPDHRGHGLTARGPADLGFMAERGGIFRVMSDVEGIGARIARESKGIPHFIFGHSMGSFVVQGLIERSGALYAGAILSGTAGPGNPLLGPGLVIGGLIRAVRGSRSRSPFLHALALGSYNAAFKPARTPYDWLSRDEAEVDAFIQDPRCGYVCSVSYYLDLVQALRSIHRKEAMACIPRKLPILLAAGSMDPVGAAPGTLDRLFKAYRKLGIEDAEKRIYPGARHEILNETNRAEVMADIADWIEARIP